MTDKTLGQALDPLDKIGTYDTVGPERMDALDLVTETLHAAMPIIEAAVRWKKQFPAGKPAHEIRWTTTTALLWEAVDAYEKEKNNGPD